SGPRSRRWRAAGQHLGRPRKTALGAGPISPPDRAVRGDRQPIAWRSGCIIPELTGDVMRALVILPTYNERENLPLIVPALLEIEQVKILIVDDQSPDGTGDLADRLAARSGGRVSVLHREGVRGLGR